MTEVIENLPFKERQELVQEFSDELVALVGDGHMDTLKALQTVAARFNTLVSQVRYGLRQALEQGLLVVDNGSLSAGSFEENTVRVFASEAELERDSEV